MTHLEAFGRLLSFFVSGIATLWGYLAWHSLHDPAQTAFAMGLAAMNTVFAVRPR